MEKTYQDIHQITLAIDCIIFGFNDNQLEVLLIHRGFEPEKERWSLIGGFVENQEDLDDAAHRILNQLTGLKNVYMEQVKTFGKLNRDPFKRVVSVTYSALILKANYNPELIKMYRAQWFPIDNLPELIFDHKDMILAAIQRLRRRVRSAPIGFNLLPEKFTLPQLRKLYEVILAEKIDKRNFRKKLKSMDFLIPIGEKDKSESKKGAFLYSFDEENYKKARNFSI